MKIIKRINNNVVIGNDSSGQEVIVFGKGIGFHEIPYELTDMSQIQRVFYGIHKEYYGLVVAIPEDTFLLASRIVDRARAKLNCVFNPNIVFTLADHINYTIIRTQKNLSISYPILYDIQSIYPEEYEVGQAALKLIQKEKKIIFPPEEAVGITLHLINNRLQPKVEDTEDYEQYANEIVKIIEDEFEFKVNRKSPNYIRFMTELLYMLRRRNIPKSTSNENVKIFESVKDEYPEIYICTLRIQLYTSKKINWK